MEHDVALVSFVSHNGCHKLGGFDRGCTKNAIDDIHWLALYDYFFRLDVHAKTTPCSQKCGKFMF